MTDEKKKNCHIKNCENEVVTTVEFRQQQIPVCKEHKDLK